MPPLTIPVCKFVGTVSLGLLTGVSYTTATQSLPSLFLLPSAATASETFAQHHATTVSHINTLTVLSVSSYTLAYTLSRRAVAHPYLLWTSLLVSLSAGVDYFLVKRERDEYGDRSGGVLKPGRKTGRTAPSSTAATPTSEDDEDYENLEKSARLNGEEVRSAMERWRAREMLRAGMSGLAFTMAVVGIWGDGNTR